MSYVKHNKIKNTGILYELLSRQITRCDKRHRKILNQLNYLKNSLIKILN